MEVNKLQKEFERWCGHNGYTRTKRNGQYNVKITRLLYQAYIAGACMGEFIAKPDSNLMTGDNPCR